MKQKELLPALLDSTLKPQLYRCLILLSWLADDNHQISISYRELGEWLNKSAGTVKGWVKHLEYQGYLYVDPCADENGSTTGNLYTIPSELYYTIDELIDGGYTERQNQ